MHITVMILGVSELIACIMSGEGNSIKVLFSSQNQADNEAKKEHDNIGPVDHGPVLADDFLSNLADFAEL